MKILLTKQHYLWIIGTILLMVVLWYFGILQAMYEGFNNSTYHSAPASKQAYLYKQFWVRWLVEADNYIININPVTGEPDPDLVKACKKLNNAHLRCDSGYPFRLPPDFIAGESVNVVHSKILNIIDEIEGCETNLRQRGPSSNVTKSGVRPHFRAVTGNRRTQ